MTRSRRIWIALLSVLALCGVFAFLQYANQHVTTSAAAPAPLTPAPTPEMGWVPKREAFVVGAGGMTSWLVSTNPAGLARFEIKATQPVNVGIMPGSKARQAIGTNRDPHIIGIILEVRFDDQANNPSACYRSNALESGQECNLGGDTDGFLIVRDPRNLQRDAAGTAIVAALGAKEPMQKLTAENRVQLTIYTWGCLRNCQHQ